MVCLAISCTSVEGRFESLLSNMHSTDSVYTPQAQPRVTSPYTLDDLGFILPPELISQHPPIKRSAAKKCSIADSRSPWQPAPNYGGSARMVLNRRPPMNWAKSCDAVFDMRATTSRSRGMLFYRLMEQAAVSAPVTYSQIRDNQPGQRRHTVPQAAAELSG